MTYETKRVEKSWGESRSFFLLAFLFFITASFSATAQTRYTEVTEAVLIRLRTQIATGDKEIKRSALFEIRNLENADASRIAVAALTDKDPVVRATAASSVIFMPRNEAAAALIPLLGDKDEFVRREAAYALGEVRDRSASSPLIRLLQREKILEVKTATALALGKIGDETAIESLTAILRARPTEDTEFLRRSAARSIGQTVQVMGTGDSKVITPQNFLPEKFKDLDPPANVVVMQTSLSDAIEILIRVLRNSNESADTRREAAFSLGAIGNERAISVLQSYTSSDDPYLAEICKEAIIKIERANRRSTD